MNPKLHFNRKYLPVLAVFAAKGDIRYYLNGFHIKPHPEQGVILSATDGHRLVVIHDCNGETNGEYIFPISTALTEAAKRSRKVIKNTRIEIVDYQLRISSLDTYFDPNAEDAMGLIEHIHYGEYLSPIDGQYPDVGRLFKEFESGEVSKVCLNVNYIASLKAIARDVNYPYIQFGFQSETGGLVALGGDDDEIVAMTMPVRAHEDIEEFEVPDFAFLAGRTPLEAVSEEAA